MKVDPEKVESPVQDEPRTLGEIADYLDPNQRMDREWLLQKLDETNQWLAGLPQELP